MPPTQACSATASWASAASSESSFVALASIPWSASKNSWLTSTPPSSGSSSPSSCGSWKPDSSSSAA